MGDEGWGMRDGDEDEVPHPASPIPHPSVDFTTGGSTCWQDDVRTRLPLNEGPMRTTFSTLMLATALAVAATTNSIEAQGTPVSNPSKSGRVPANGIDYYYEIHGSGEPLLLLHGGLGSIDMFRSSLLPALAKTRQVIAVDLQGHGRTTLGDRPIDLVDIGNDLAVVLEKLGYKQVDVAGYSFGGGAGLRLAIQHPTLVRRLAVISAPFAQSGFFPEMLPQQAAVGSAMAEQMKETPMYQSYVAVAPNPK